MNNKKYIGILSVLCFVLLITVIFSVVYPLAAPEDKLTLEEIEKIREENDYKIYKNSANSQMSTQEMTFREIITYRDTYVYCEVIKNPEYVAVNLETGDKEFDDNWSNGLRKQPQLQVYTVKVLADSENLIDKGSVFTYSYGLLEQAYCPTPELGDKIVLSVVLGPSDSTTDMYSGKEGYYYVTEEGYVVSAFEEDGLYRYSGKKVENLLDTLKKSESESKDYLDFIKMRYERSGGKDGYESIEMLREQIKEKLEARKNAEK